MDTMSYRDVFYQTMSFKDIEKYMFQKGLCFDSNERHLAFLFALIKALTAKGNTKLPISLVYSEASNYFFNENYNTAKFANDINALIKKDLIVCKKRKYIGIKSIFNAEYSIAKRVKEHLIGTGIQYEEADKVVSELEQTLKYPLGKQQREAVLNSLLEMFVILIGGPGTGKTTTLKKIIDVHKLLNPKLRIGLVAPTGVASKRMASSCGYPAFTIQKFLHAKCNEEESGELKICSYEFNMENKFKDYDMIIVDETSMVDSETMCALLEAIDIKTKIVLVGDSNQLPSVGPGNVLYDLIHFNYDEHRVVSKLTETFRQQNDSLIIENTKRISNGENNLLFGKDFQMIDCPSHMITNKLIELVGNNVFYKNENLILSASRKNKKTGVDGINRSFQKRCKKDNLCFYVKNNGVVKKFYNGDPIIFTKNTERVKNGDVGFITDVIKRNGVITGVEICVDGVYEKFQINSCEIKGIDLSYAITVHKSQGSEAENVYVVLDENYKQQYTKELLFTAVSRAKKRCILIGQLSVVRAAINKKAGVRSTWISPENLKQ